MIGGCHGSSGLRSSVVYDSSVDKWEFIAKLQQGEMRLTERFGIRCKHGLECISVIKATA